MDKKCKNGQNDQFSLFLPTLPPGNGPLMTIESWNMYKMPFKSDNLSLGMILAQKSINFGQKMQKNGENDQFSLFLTNVTP